MAGELDLGAFISDDSASDDDIYHRDPDGTVPLRTVDDILNSGSSSDSDSQPEQETKPRGRLASQSSLPAPEKSETRQETEASPVITLRDRSTSLDLPSSSSQASSSSDTLTSLVLRGFSDKPLPPLFRGVRVANPRPGAALAAAAAASRSVGSRHAAALKLRRIESTSRTLEKESSGVVDEDVREVEAEGEFGISSSAASLVGDSEELTVSLNANENLNKTETEGVNLELTAELETVQPISKSSENVLEGEHEHTLNGNVMLDNVLLNADSGFQEIKEEKGHELVNNSEQPDNPKLVTELGIHVDMQNLKEQKPPGSDPVSENLDQISMIHDKPETSTYTTLEVAENLNDVDNLTQNGETLGTEVDDLIEKAVEIAKKAEKKMKSSMKPLEYYEEIEKRQASYGLHYEEGAMAQPMRLEGIRRGPPAVGYLQIDLDNAATRFISSQEFRREHGAPQVVVVHRAYIAFGMSGGRVFVFPSKYSIYSSDNMDSKMSFPNLGEKAPAPVTSMCFNQQGDFLLVGYQDGHLTIWDVARSAPAKTISGEHTAPVVHSLFLGQESSSSRQYKAITGDSKGFVLLHTFSVLPLLNRFTIKSQRLLEGQKNGVVLSASALVVDEPYGLTAGVSTQAAYASTSSGGLSSMMGGVVGGVLFNEGGGSSGPTEEGVVIFVTHQNALVVKLGANVEVYEKFSRPEGVREGSLPYTAWKCVLGSPDTSSEEHERISWLAIAWDRRVQVYKLVKSEMKKHTEWNIDSAAIGVAWLDDQMLVLLNTRGQLCLFTKDASELHRTSITPHDGSSVDDIITYHTHFLNVYGNPEKSYHNSVSVRGSTVYILGPRHLMVSRLLPWKERIQVLQRAGDWMGALDMAMRLYDGHTQGVVDLPRKIGDIHAAIMPFLVELLLSYVDEVFSYILVRGQNGKETEIEEQYARVGGVAVEYCVHISRIDILFDTVFSRFLAVQQGGSFLEILEPYILKDMLGCLPPEIMQALVEYYNEKGWLQRVEQCILHMDISSLDFNQVVRLCREHGLYGALIYLFNQGLNDYRAPLEELLSVVQSSPRKEASRTCYRMLVYLKYCFEGLAFPPGHGRIPMERVRSVRIELLQFLLEESRSQSSQICQNFRSSCNTCPNLCYLLLIDTAATLEVTRLALTKPEQPDQEEDLDQTTLDTTVQDLMNVLIQLLGLENETLREIDLDDETRIWPSQKDLGHLMEFVSYLASHRGASLSSQSLKHVLVYLTEPQKGLAFENEKEVLRLFRVLPSTAWCSDDVLELCSKAEFHQACGLIHSMRGNNVAAMDCYMKDTEDPFHAFAFIDSMLSENVSSDEGATSFHSVVMSRVHDLVKLNRTCTFFLILDHFDGESQEVLSRLKDHPESLFLFLKTAIDVHLSRNLSINESCILKDEMAVGDYLKRLTNNQKIPIEKNPIQVTDEIVELYLELLCQYEQGSVLKFLQTFDNYRLEHCLRLCLEHGATDAAAFLLERVGDVSGALDLIMKGLDEKFESLIASLEHHHVSSDFSAILKTKEAMSVLDVLHSSIDLCQRNMQRIDEKESEALWFHLFDAFSQPLKRLSGGKGIPVLRRVFSQFVGEIIEGMAGCIPLPAIMAKLLSDSGNQEFGDFKLIILKMLSTYGYEKRILDTAKSVIEDDTFYTLSLLKRAVSHAFAPQSLTCCICNSSLHKIDSSPKIRLYSCGHATHLTCQSEEHHAHKPSKEYVCPICLPKKGTTPHEENGLVGFYASNGKQKYGTDGVQRIYEADSSERSRISQVSRFEILSHLQKSKKPFQMDPLPQLRLSPPVIYHETVNRSSNSRGKSINNSTIKGERSKRPWQIKDLKSKGFLFGSEKSRTRWLDI